MRIFGLSAVLVLVGFVTNVKAVDKPEQMWLFYPTNFAVDENLDHMKEVWTRAAAAGYTHVLIGDSKFGRLVQMDAHYFANCEKAKKLAASLKLQLVPSVFPVGYSNDILGLDPNLAEGMPVRDEPLVVKNGEVVAEGDPSTTLEKVSFKDDNVILEDGVATVHQSNAPSRIVFGTPVAPFRSYRVSVKVKTDGYNGQPEVKVLAGGPELQLQSLYVPPTTDWMTTEVVFNSLDNKKVSVYFGFWTPTNGHFQWKDWKITEVPFMNVLRRPGTPVVIKEAASGKKLTEGVEIDPVVDPKMGVIPWPGGYEVFHSPPVIHSKLPEGTRLLASWYHPTIIYGGQVAMCTSDPKAVELLKDQARRMKELWNAPLYMMSHDEIRTLDWDESCLVKKQTPGELLSDNLKMCTDLLRPAKAADWSDMFDPYHNAIKGPYYLVNGSYEGSWKGLDKDVLIMQWNLGKADESIKFFHDRGNPQIIAGYYDGPWEDVKKWNEAAARSHGAIQGFMYTTWAGNYADLEKYAQTVGMKK